MRISRTRSFKINLGHFESMELGATVTLSHGDLGYTDEDVADDPDAMAAELRSKCRELLTEELRDEIAMAIELTDEDKSFVLHQFKLDHPEKRS